MARLGYIGLGMMALCSVFSLRPAPAQACGGFFCNNSQPVVQSAEKIIFSQNADGTVTAVIEISYSGPSERFAWVLPVAGSPEIGVSSNQALRQLQALTSPQYTLATTVEGTCREEPFSGGFTVDAASSTFADAGAAGGPEPERISVVDRGSVGPYDFVVISVDPEAVEIVDTALAWLRDNRYDVDSAAGPLLATYLVSGMNLLAFRLTKGNNAGSIRPVMITFGEGLPSIPIRPTAVAATADMGVMVWVVGDHRAVPVNYRSLELNEALINWFNPMSTYEDVVTAAANEAGGQGFVTEMAGPSEALAGVVFPDSTSEAWAAIQEQDWNGREGELLSEALLFASWDGMSDVIRDTVPAPEGVMPAVLLSCPSCYYGRDVADIDGFEPAAFLDAVARQVIEPMRRTQELLSARPYVTRLYTTMSPDEMSKDPYFDFNPDLGDYSNIHGAERIIECSRTLFRSEAPWRVELETGDVVRGSGRTWPLDVSDGDVPANRVIRALGTSGPGVIVEDNRRQITAALRNANLGVPAPVPSTERGDCSVSAVGGRSVGSGIAAGLFSMALLVRRRRRRTKAAKGWRGTVPL